MTRKNLMNSLLATGAFGGMTANERRLGRFIRDGEGHPAAPAATPAPEPSNEDPFAAAFAEHATDAPAAPAAPAGSEAPAATPAPDAAPAGGGAPAQPAPGPADGATPPAAPAAPAAPAGDAGATPPAQPPAGTQAPAGDGGKPPAVAPSAKPAPTAEEIVNGLVERLGQQPPAAQPAAQPEAPAAPQLYNEQELAQLTEYEKNWPDVAAAETLKRRGEYHDIVAYVFKEMGAYVAPLFEQQRLIGNTLHTQELSQKVEGYSAAEEDAVVAWVDSQPSYLQSAYKQVMQGGTSDEVADLIGRYRAATGAAPTAPLAPPAAPAAPAPTASAPAPVVPAKTELSSAAMQAVASLAPVSGERSAVPQGENLADFDSSFAKYATMD